MLQVVAGELQFLKLSGIHYVVEPQEFYHLTENPQKRNGISLSRRQDFFILVSLLSLTILVFAHSLGNDFVRNWDDALYVTDNNLIKDFSWHGIGKIFSTIYLDYYPVTLTAYALQYAFFGLDPADYHAVSLILHCLNVILVYYLAKNLTGWRFGAAIVALLFGIHPMHVESVAWISEQKDLLYASFSLGGLLSYLYYLRFRADSPERSVPAFRSGAHWATIGFFAFAILSKSAAAVLPFVLLLMERYISPGGRVTFRDKIPFFLGSIIFGIITIVAQKSTGALSTSSAMWSPLDRTLFSSYALVVYLIKAIVPVNLSAFYPYPSRIGGGLPVAYYASAVIVLSLAIFIGKLSRGDKDLRFGSLFFMLNIALFLQIIPVGGAMLAERYTYLSYIGIFFVGSQYLSRLNDRTGGSIKKSLFYTALAGYIILLSLIAHLRTTMWSDDITLLSDAIDKNPSSDIAYLSRGISRRHLHQTERALDDLNNAIRLSPDLIDAYYNRGLVYQDLHNMPSALDDFTRIISLKPEDASAYAARGNLYDETGDYQAAIRDLTEAIRLEPAVAESYNLRGVAYGKIKDSKSAIADYTRAIEIRPDYAEAFNNRGTILSRTGDMNGALEDFTKAVRYRPGFTEALYNRGVCYEVVGNNREAVRDLSAVLDADPANQKAVYRRFVALLALKRLDEALSDLKTYYSKSPDSTSMYNDLSILYGRKSQFDSAVVTIRKAIHLTPGRASLYNNLGYYYAELGDYPSAKKNFLTSISLDAHRWAPRLGLAVISADIHDRAAAESNLTIAEELEPRLRDAEGLNKLESEGYFYSGKFSQKFKKLLTSQSSGMKSSD